MNKVILYGNMTRDPEVHFTNEELAVCSFGLAINRAWKGADGKLHEEVTFVDVTAFGKRGEVIGKRFSKGKPILVEGRLKLDQWDDKTSGQRRSKLVVILEDFRFVGGAPGQADGGGDPSGAGSVDDGDVPF